MDMHCRLDELGGKFLVASCVQGLIWFMVIASAMQLFQCLFSEQNGISVSKVGSKQHLESKPQGRPFTSENETSSDTHQLVRDLSAKQPPKRIPSTVASRINEYIGDTGTMTGEELERIAVLAKETKKKRAWASFYTQVLLPEARNGKREITLYSPGLDKTMKAHFADLTTNDICKLSRQQGVKFDRGILYSSLNVKFSW